MWLKTSTLISCAIFSSVLGQSNSTTSSYCKCVPGQACWPSAADFQALNQTVNGKLLQGVPPGSVCYKDQQNYNQTECQYVRDNWLVSTFHALNPVSIGWSQFAGNPCPPIYENGTSVNGDPDAGAKGCKLGGYPVYALNATSAQDVQAVAKFTTDHNIRLNVKSTGHSFQGRSVAFGSISIWTHWLQGITYEPNFQPDSCTQNSTSSAFRMGAGVRVRDVYEAANKQNMVAVGGSAQDVGIVGWFTSGGHGPLTSTYGMGVDNVLQVKIVTTDGQLLTANECQNPDLFWAIRGGGGGTFGIITEVVMKGYPALPVQSQGFSIQPIGNDTTDFWKSVTYFWSELPRLKAGGLSGYAYIIPPGGSAFGGTPGQPGVAGSYLLFGQSNGTASSLFQPIDNFMATLNKTVNYTNVPSYDINFFESWNNSIGYEAVGGGGGVLGSRLLPASSLTSSSAPHLSSVLQNLTTQPLSTGLQFFMVANSDTSHNVSLNPAWRSAVLHVITVGFFRDNATYPEQRAVYDTVTYDYTAQLKTLAPDSGSYINEGDPNDPNWQYTFYNVNYPRLKAVKNRYDPQMSLWCRACVGSEDWIPHSKYGDENGEGQLCRASWVAQTVLSQ